MLQMSLGSGIFWSVAAICGMIMFGHLCDLLIEIINSDPFPGKEA